MPTFHFCYSSFDYVSSLCKTLKYEGWDPHPWAYIYFGLLIFLKHFLYLQVAISQTFELPIFYAYVLLCLLPHPLSCSLLTQWN